MKMLIITRQINPVENIKKLSEKKNGTLPFRILIVKAVKKVKNHGIESSFVNIRAKNIQANITSPEI